MATTSETYHSVIPAKAGIQHVKELRVAGKAVLCGVVPLVELLAIRLGCQKTPANSLVMRGF